MVAARRADACGAAAANTATTEADCDPVMDCVCVAVCVSVGEGACVGEPDGVSAWLGVTDGVPF